MSGFYHKHFLKLLGFAPAELNSLLQLAMKLKVGKKSDKEETKLTGKNIALIFEEDSTRTRCSFEVTAYDQGVRVAYLGSSDNQIDHKESIKDTARALGRMYDDIQYHGYGQEIVETLTEYAGVPAWDDLTNEPHPAQLLADLLTMQEHLSGKAFNGMTLIYAGDTRNNMGSSMPEAAVLIGLDLRLIAPQTCWPEATLITEYCTLAQQSGGNITPTEDVAKRIEGADLIYTDVWVSMGEAKEKWAERIALLHDYQVNSKVMQLTGNPEVGFLHCLPTFHDDQTTLDKGMAKEFGLHDGMGVTNEVFESAISIVFDQVENRMHTIKATMVTALSKQLISL